MQGNAREVRALAANYHTGPNGLLRVSAPVAFGHSWLAPKLPAFLAAYPDVDVKVTLIDRQIDLVNDGVDLAIRNTKTLSPRLASRQLLPSSPAILIASHDYIKRKGEPKTPRELEEPELCHQGYGRFTNN